MSRPPHTIGLFGGTFNPPHMGHLIVAEHVRDALALDQILFMPTATPPHKQGSEILEAGHRLAMVRAAVEGNPSFAVSDREIVRGGVSYTVDTMRDLQALHPGGELFLLTGADAEFDTWKNPEEILTLARLVIMGRPGFAVDPSLLARRPGRVLHCEVPAIDISSSALRTMVHEGHSVRYLVPDAVLDYIRDNRLYR